MIRAEFITSILHDPTLPSCVLAYPTPPSSVEGAARPFTKPL